jgi:protein-S-isoprenylcysteine O-methyltransferase Ste14
MTEADKPSAVAHGAPRDGEMKVHLFPPGHFMGSSLATVVLGTFSLGGDRMRIRSSPSGQIDWGMAVTGLACFGGAVTLFRKSVATFKKHQTPVPHGYKVSTIVSEGVFSYTRNPIYVAMVTGVLSLGAATNTLWGAVAASYLAGAIGFFVIPFEEAYLTEQFGQTYEDYKAKVPRWILF